MGLGTQLALLLWKNWIIQKRRVCVSIIEIGVPILFAFLFLYLRRVLPKIMDRKSEAFDITSVRDVYRPLRRSSYSYTRIGYYPKTSETTAVMKIAMNDIRKRSYNKMKLRSILGFDTEKSALKDVLYSRLTHVVKFDVSSASSASLPKNIKFTVRPVTAYKILNTDATFPYLGDTFGFERKDFYDRHHVLMMQALVGEALIQYWVQKAGRDPYSIRLDVLHAQMPLAPAVWDPMVEVHKYVFPNILVLSFITSVTINTKSLVSEKQLKLKESMKLMGLHASSHWLSWFITFAIYLVPVLGIYCIILCWNVSETYPPVLRLTEPSLFFCFLLCYSFALITFCFMISTFFQKATNGAAMAGILFYAFFVPWEILEAKYSSSDRSTKLTYGLFFNTAMAIGSYVIVIYEKTGEGVNWSNFYRPAIVDDNVSLLDSMLLLLLDSFLHLIIAWYMDNVMPGEFGIPRPYTFCFTKSYWMPDDSIGGSMRDSEVAESKYFERDPTGLIAGIKLIQLRKVFGGKVAVKGTSLRMYKGQITVLLGHNGAGKTTTMSMLTGFIPPTSGTAEVNGFDIRTNLEGVRQSLGVCPQHDILFGSLTVREHLIFFAKLKGCDSSKIDDDVQTTGEQIGLGEKLDSLSKTLSGGQKRKLSVGIALIGGSEVVILDEPTAGMDAAARRDTWNLLQSARRGRTILLSTHYMDEADLLGDRIAIMADGVVKCCGSALFLKKLYGAGYHLVVVKGPGFDVDKVNRVIWRHIPTFLLESERNREVSYILPDTESACFAPLFTELDETKDELGFTSFGISATTMEEVFLRVGDGTYDVEERAVTEANTVPSTKTSIITDAGQLSTHNLEKGSSPQGLESNSTSTQSVKVAESVYFNKGFTKNTGFALDLAIIRAMFVKKALTTWRSRLMTLIQVLMPVVFTTLGLIPSPEKVVEVEPELTLDLSPFGGTYIPFMARPNATGADERFAAAYRSQFGPSETLEELPPTKLAMATMFRKFHKHCEKRMAQLGATVYTQKMIIGMGAIRPWKKDIDLSLAAIAYYSGVPFHAAGISMNYLMNAFLQAVLNDSFSLQTSISPIILETMFTTESESSDQDQKERTPGFLLSTFINFGMAFLTSMFIYNPIKERQVGAKHMQVVSGVGPITYWLPTFMWDFINFIFPSMLLLVVFAAYSETAYVDDGRWAIVILVLAMYGWAILPAMYAFQFLFTSPATGTAMGIIVNIVSGLVTTITITVLEIFEDETKDTRETLESIFMIISPNYNMGSSFIKIKTKYKEHCNSSIDLDQDLIVYECPSPPLKSFLAWEKPGIWSFLVYMAAQGFIYILIVMFLEYRVYWTLWYFLNITSEASVVPYSEDNSDDSDVAAERRRLQLCRPSKSSFTDKDVQDSLLLINLYKRYGDFVAVNHLYLGVPDKECFGLLGQNGAGKTTTFKMLTGDVMVTSGNAYLKGYGVRNHIKKVQANMGYCPQFDALLDHMTGRETLVMYARIRGVPEDSIPLVVNSLMDILMLGPEADRFAGGYSGGNKRKLSTAIALVGDPSFLLLDEPSCGVDPKARRQLWNVLSQVRASGRTLVVTSHSMEECDALCTRLAIMVNGRFVCLGSPQHLKNKFGQGYTIVLQMRVLEDGSTAPNEPVITFVLQNFADSQVFDEHQGYVHFQVPAKDVKLAQIFSIMESAKEELHIEDYSVQQTTLEQVFIAFTRSQVFSRETKPRSCLTKTCCCCCIAAGIKE